MVRKTFIPHLYVYAFAHDSDRKYVAQQYAERTRIIYRYLTHGHSCHRVFLPLLANQINLSK